MTEALPFRGPQFSIGQKVRRCDRDTIAFESFRQWLHGTGIDPSGVFTVSVIQTKECSGVFEHDAWGGPCLYQMINLQESPRPLQGYDGFPTSDFELAQ